MVARKDAKSSRSPSRARSRSPAASATRQEKEVADTHTAGEQEFGGPLGCFGIMVFSHFVMYYFYLCNFTNKGALSYPSEFSLPAIQEWAQTSFTLVWQMTTPTWYATGIYTVYVAIETLFSVIMPGIWVKGLPVPSEGMIAHDYLCNGVLSWYASILIGIALHYSGIWRLTELADNFGPVMTVSVIAGNVLAGIIYIAAKIQKCENRATGNVFYDYFMGNYLNPRIGYFDFKMWSEIRVSWKLLFLLTVSAALKQYETHGVITYRMLFMVLAHFLYTNACQKGEECIPTTWDIFYENWGWMLCFWNLAGVPFVYCFQSYYILMQPPEEFHPVLQVLHYLFLLGAYYVWDTANSQKNRFRMMIRGNYVPRKTFPQLPWGTLHNPKYIKAKCGSTLLIDGWWGKARKIHYTADLCMALSWGLACGWGFLPYFYVLFFLSHLSHRILRDMERCSKKYGDDWDLYIKTVPYIFIPGVF